MMSGNGQDSGKEPVERVVDLFVHMPIGLAVMAWKRVPDFVVSVPGLVNEALSKGCTGLAQAEERLTEEVRKARMIGQVAVTFGGRQLRREVDARLRDARQTAGGLASFLPGSGDGSNGAAAARTAESVTATATPTEPVSAKPTEPVSAKPTGARRTAKPTGARKTAKATPAKAARPAATKRAEPTKATRATKASSAAKATTAAAAAPPPALAADLPIREYDGLSASQVVSRLTGLTPGELRAVRAYEDASRGRRTVILAIDRLLAGPGAAGTAP
jgi:hypothetical protein